MEPGKNRETAPVICPKCNFEQAGGMPSCARCGVIFAKLRSIADREARPPEMRLSPAAASAGHSSRLSRLFELLTAVAPGDALPLIAGRGILLALMLFWGWRFITASIASGYAGDSLLHLINLPFHEAGHVIFGLLGIRFITVLGGTLGQLLIPLVVACAFVKSSNNFGGSVGLWWLGENFMDAAIYANDARAGQLPLLGGVTGSEVEDYHDWEYMLGKLGWLQHDHLIAGMLYACGTLLIILALSWGGFLLWRQMRLRNAGD
jgi:hypothetical protein